MIKNKKNFQIIISFILLLFISIMINNMKVNADSPVKNKTKTIFVDIKGSINSPGVYELNYNSRVIDLINKAGGLTENADTSIINLSKKLEDESVVIIYTNDEIKDYKEKLLSSTEIVKEINKKIICPDSDNDACINQNNINTKSNKSSSNNNVSSEIININNAPLSELQTLPGIGESKAKRIIEYRNNKKFENIEEIKQVSGIGDSLFEKIKEHITV